MRKLYIVYVHITPDGMHYYGVTSNIKHRWSGNGCMYKHSSLYPYIEKFGWENIQHKVLYENLSYNDALLIEDSLILSGREKGNCINKHRSGNVSKEDDYNKNQMKYIREHNREGEIKKQKQYYEDNKDKIKQYYEDNKDKKRKYQREYSRRKKEEKQFKELGYIPLF